MFKIVFALMIGLLVAPVCDKRANGGPMNLFSSAFTHNGSIPSRYTCEGEDISPHLSWDNVPKGTKSLALIVDDPDAPHGTYVHWLAWNINPNEKELGSGIKASAVNIVQGINHAQKAGYKGPCPPSGEHRYYFKLYALDLMLGLPKNSNKEDLLSVIKGHILAQSELVGRYKKNN